MSFIGRASVWAARAAGSPTEQPRVRLTPLNQMTGSRIAASDNGVVRWVRSEADADPRQPRRGPRLADIFARIARPGDGRQCPRCGKAEHIDFGHEYERLVCQEITAA